MFPDQIMSFFFFVFVSFSRLVFMEDKFAPGKTNATKNFYSLVIRY